jgi:hypothetical protein
VRTLKTRNWSYHWWCRECWWCWCWCCCCCCCCWRFFGMFSQGYIKYFCFFFYGTTHTTQSNSFSRLCFFSYTNTHSHSLSLSLPLYLLFENFFLLYSSKWPKDVQIHSLSLIQSVTCEELNQVHISIFVVVLSAWPSEI